MTATQQEKLEAVASDGAVVDETDSSSRARNSGTTCSYADLIIQISEQSSAAKSAGTRWEQVVVSFLSTDPPYRRRFASVEPFADWAARDAIRGTSQDRGVDLIAIQHDRKIRCHQIQIHRRQTDKLGKHRYGVLRRHPRTESQTRLMTLNDRNLMFADNPETLLPWIRQPIQVSVETNGQLAEFPEEFEVA